ncbi:hypothetical protein GCM10007874_58680 [Labrys miyagiensis]|uniref:Secreted protein n=1 Tax=Labrys miyagiensis TaxID=346912 RepID=A0ABQ6CR90_9HYPH|nr:hypothetical protein GCM10007874_58680 [Labrys miyagiensis]
MSGLIAIFVFLTTISTIALETHFIDQAFPGETIEKCAPVECQPDVQHETRNVPICGFNDAAAPNAATYKCYNYYSYTDK